MKAENKKSYIDTIYLAIGELIVSLLVIIVYLFIPNIFDWTVITGVALGSIVTILNYIILSLSVDRAIKKFMDLRGDKEMDEEEAEAFAKANTVKVQNAITKSYLFRTALMMGALILSLVTGYFDTIATVIPLIMYKPLLYAVEFVKKKRGE